MATTYFVQTPRLLIRPLADTDFDLYFRMQADPELMRYIRLPESDADAVRGRMATQLNYGAENPGLGSMVSISRETGQPVATGVLRHVDYQPGNDLELGYAVLRDFWGRGLATEIARALARYAFERFDAPRVFAFVDPENYPSQQVLQKCGFRLNGRRLVYDADCLEFLLEREGLISR